MSDKKSPELPDDAESMSVASALIRARNDLGMTQAHLADASGVSRSAIKGYETGRNMPGARELKAICRVLRVSPNSLLYGTETPFSGKPTDADTARPLRDLLNDPEESKHMRARLVALADLLTTDERSALMNLIHSLAVARHGPEVVKKSIIAADLLASVMQTMLSESGRLMNEGGELDPKAVAASIEGSMFRHGHGQAEGAKKVSKKTS